jgi:hypothetical protein
MLFLKIHWVEFIDVINFKNEVYKRSGKNNPHIAGWLKAWLTRHEFDSCAKHWFVSVLSHCSPSLFFRIFFAYDQRYPLEISTGTGVIGHADSEYAIYFNRERFLKSSSGVICFNFNKNALKHYYSSQWVLAHLPKKILSSS